MSSGGGTRTETVTSPAQERLFRAMFPVAQQMGRAAQRGKPLYQVPTYDVPSTTGLMPTADWYSGIAPEVMQGVWAPYQDAAQQLGEQLGIGGGASARGGWSGTAAAGLGKFYEQAGRNVGQQAWGMVQPALAADWQAELGKRQWGAQSRLGAMAAPFGGAGMVPQALPTPVVSQDTGSFSPAGALTGGLGGLGMGASIAALNPYMWPIAGAGALAGGLGGGK